MKFPATRLKAERAYKSPCRHGGCCRISPPPHHQLEHGWPPGFQRPGLEGDFCPNTLADPGGPGGPAPPLPPQIFFQNHMVFRQAKGKTHILSKFWAQGPWGQNSAGPHLTKILLRYPNVLCWMRLKIHVPDINFNIVAICVVKRVNLLRCDVTK